MGVVSHTNAAGDVSIGIEDQDGFVPFVTLSEGKIGQLKQRHSNLVERAKAGDDLAIDVLGTAFKREPAGGGSLHDLSRDELVDIAEQKGIEGVTTKTTKAELVEAIESHDAQENGS